MWSKVKTALRRAQARSQDALMHAIAAALEEVTPDESERFFCHCGVSVKS